MNTQLHANSKGSEKMFRRKKERDKGTIAFNIIEFLIDLATEILDAFI